MKDFRIHNLPAVTHVWGQPLAEPLPARFGLSLICSRGMRWDGGEFATREEAVAEGERRTGRAPKAPTTPAGAVFSAACFNIGMRYRREFGAMWPLTDVVLMFAYMASACGHIGGGTRLQLADLRDA